MAKLNDIEQTDLTASERARIAQDELRWKKMAAGAHLDDWLSIGETLMIGRRLAMKVNHVNRPEGRGYSETFSAWMETHGFHTMPRTAVSCVLWLLEDAERVSILRTIRETMTVGQRARLNSPIAARQRVEKALKTYAGGDASELVRPSAVFKLKEAVAEQQRQIAHLQEQLATAEQRDGSLFDLRKDQAGDIVGAIMANVSPNKAREIARGLLKAIEKPKPAG